MTTKKVTARYTVETMTAIGGDRWQRGDKDRIYTNDWERFIDLEITRYNTGNIRSAYLGRPSRPPTPSRPTS
ncbi:hypothetical protein ACFY4C_40175 [Actinomadura viridis]|uniref:hypothetical protein n=1 Tax=Actinomadura viridis TaxID=58110 RepID=UPI00368F723F